MHRKFDMWWRWCRVTGRKLRGGMRATISYTPPGLHVSRLSVEKKASTTEFPRRHSSGTSLTRAARNVPLLNLNSLNAPTQKAGIGGNQLQFSNRSLSSKTGTKKKRTNSDKLDNENDKPNGDHHRSHPIASHFLIDRFCADLGLLSQQFSVECDDLCPTPSMTVPSGSQPVRDRSIGRNPRSRSIASHVFAQMAHGRAWCAVSMNLAILTVHRHSVSTVELERRRDWR